MNDLEIIKQLCDVDVPYNEVCSIEANALGEIQEAATRMANRIAELEEDLIIKEQKRLGVMNATIYWYDNYQDSLTEITRLQDKIEKYNCANCKHLCGPNDANCVECMEGTFDYMSVNNLTICALKCRLWEAKSERE